MKKLMFLFPILCLAACETSVSNIEVEVLTDEVSVVVENDEFVCGRDKVKDADGNEYKTAYFDIEGGHDVGKDGQCWMAENLNVGVKQNSLDVEPQNNEIPEWYSDGGVDGLYHYPEVVNYDFEKETICPSGWDLPLRAEWFDLFESVAFGLEEMEYNKLLTGNNGIIRNLKEGSNLSVQEQFKEKERQDRLIAEKLREGLFDLDIRFTDRGHYFSHFFSHEEGYRGEPPYGAYIVPNFAIQAPILKDKDNWLIRVGFSWYYVNEDFQNYDFSDEITLGVVRCMKK